MSGEKRKSFLAVIVFFALVAVVSLLTLGYRYMTAEVKGRVAAEEQLESASSRIQRYEQFFDMCSTVVEKKASLKSQKKRLEFTTDEKSKNRIYANIAALESQIAGDVSRYNNEARKGYTSGRFFDDRLPKTLKVEGETFCAR